MKTNNIIRTLIVASTSLLAAASSQAANRTLILLQENSNGKSYMTDILPAGPVRTAADAIIDQFAENGEAAKLQALAAGRFQRFVNLSDANCTRAKLLAELIKQTNDGFTVDLEILGHGNVEVLGLHDGETLTGRHTVTTQTRTGPVDTVVPGSIRTLLTDARAQQGAAFNFKLRVVHMCNCFGGTTNDDWLAIGAKVAVGAPKMDWMPEPMITLFWQSFLSDDKRVTTAASSALATTRVLWQAVPGYNTVQENGLTKIQETQQLVSGNGNLIFKDEYQLAVNQSRTFTVNANRTHTFPQVYLVAGQTYSISSSSTDTWVNGIGIFAKVINANGYTPGSLDGLRRNSGNMMRLTGERFTHPTASNPLNFIGGSGFSIGTSRTLTAPGHGFLNLYANDVITGYADNSGSISVTVRRTL